MKRSGKAATAKNDKWDIVCEPAILEKLKSEERFWQVIALARSVNALSFAHWAMVPVMEDDSLHAQRTRTNSFFSHAPFSMRLCYWSKK